MKPIKQLCKASVFLLAALLSVTACDSAGEGSETTPLTEADPLGGGKMIYTIVRGDNSSKEECDAAVRLRTTLRDTYGIDIAIETDWVKRGENVDDHRFGNEIIIGTTNRNESIAAKEKLNEGTRDQIDYILSRDDEDYIIVSSAGGAEAAVDAFLAEFAKDPTMLTRTPGAMDISAPHVFPLDDVVIGGTSIFDFDAIYCPDTCSKIAQADAASLKSLLFRACGATLPFVTTAGEGDRLISYYPHTDAEMLEAGGFSYAMVPGDSGLILDGCDEYTAACALDLFREDLTAAMEQGGTYTLDTPERILRAPAEDNLILSAWVISSTPITEEAQFAEIADCGFNQVIISKPTDDQTLYNYGKWMSRQGLRALWHDNQIAQHDAAPATMEGADAPYVDIYVT
ncbi:MAG: hypothetical protein MJ175_11610 [Clostridia bacterium]|nr:hypothetical protein [Clostridia bacterium]